MLGKKCKKDAYKPTTYIPITKIVIIFFKNLIIFKRPKNIFHFSSKMYFAFELRRIPEMTGQIGKIHAKTTTNHYTIRNEYQQYK